MSTPFYDLASLVVVPSGYKASKVYAQKPLTTDGQLTFSRASTATRVNASGLIETVSSNVPRLDYLGSTCPKLQLEPQRSNIITRSSEFDSVAWTKTSIAVTANDTVSPDGTSTADLFTTNDPAATVYRAYHNSTGGTDASNSISAFFKYGNHPFAYIAADYSAAGKFAVFNVQTGVITATSSGYTSTITDYGNGWYRCTLTGTFDSNNNVQLGLAPNANVYAGSSLANGKTLYVWGAQREYNVAYPTSLIQTTTAAVTRLADACSKTGIGSLIGVNKGSIFMEFDVKGLDTGAANYLFDLSDGTNFDANRISMYWTTSNDFIVFYGYGGTYSQAIYSSNFATTKKVGVRWTSTQLQVIINGVAQTAVTYGNSSPTKLNIASRFNGVEYLASNVKQCILFNNTLTTAQLQELTTL